MINPEATRIVDSLRQPEQSLEQLLNSMTCRRADGREISLMEVSMAEALSAGETVRAEEIVLRVPDGRSVSALLDATPIFSEEGVVESFVMTLQDMAPREDLERMRAEFLGTVSHELRTPLTSIRGSATTLLDDSSALHPAEMRQYYRIIVEQSDRMGGLISSLVDVARIETGTLPADPRPVKVTDIVDEARRIFLSGGGMNEIHIDLAGYLPLVMADPQRIVQVLGNLLSNAGRYSPMRPRSGSAPCGRSCTWPSPSQTKARACRPSGCRTCSRSFSGSPMKMGDANLRGRAWVLRSAKG